MYVKTEDRTIAHEESRSIERLALMCKALRSMYLQGFKKPKAT